jgi:pyruvate carboxylase
LQNQHKEVINNRRFAADFKKIIILNATATYYLFVYGTLRTAMNNPLHKIIRGDVEWIGETEVQGELYDLGNYPGAVPSHDKASLITGEVLKIKSEEKVLKILDEYEGLSQTDPGNTEFRRDEVNIKLPAGNEAKAWIYWYNFSTEGKERIAEKDYLDYLKKKKSTLYGA